MINPYTSVETTAHTLTFLLGHLALFPDVQRKVFEEVQRVWPEEQNVVAAENVCSLSAQTVLLCPLTSCPPVIRRLFKAGE